MRVQIFDLDDPGWSECLNCLRHDIYHNPAYVQIEANRLGAKPEAFLASEGDRLFFLPYLVRSCQAIVLENELASQTFDVVSPYGYPGILLSDQGRQAIFAQRALEALRTTLSDRGVCSGFFRMHPLLNQDIPELFSPNVFTDAGETVAINLLLGEDALWKQLREGHQGTIARCRKLGFTARMVPLGDCLDEFLTIYLQTMDRVKAKQDYYFDRDYFQQLAQLPGVSCCVAEKDREMASACIFLECGDIVQAHLGGTRTKYLTRSPFHLVLYEAALWAKSRGNSYLHLGGGVGGANDKLFHFKAGFSRLRFRFFTLRLITNEARHHQLVGLRAASLNVSPEALLRTNYFPPYRSGF